MIIYAKLHRVTGQNLGWETHQYGYINWINIFTTARRKGVVNMHVAIF